MVSTTISESRPSDTKRSFSLSRITPDEGWLTVLLHLLLITVAVQTVANNPWMPTLDVLIPGALCATLTGFVLAKSRVPDFLAHVISFFAGLILAAIWIWVSIEQLSTWKSKLFYLRDRIEVWTHQFQAGKPIDDTEMFVFLLIFTVWMVAYSSAWILYRRRWLLPSIALPMVVVLSNLAYSETTSTKPLIVFLIGSLVLAVRHNAYQRQLQWAQQELPSPDHLPWRFVRAGIALAVVVVLIGWSIPPGAAQPLIQRLTDRLDQPLSAIEDRWGNWASFLGENGSSGESFSSFKESFQLGGELNLSDDPVALVQADQPVYLAVHRYNWYDGHGWSTDIQDTFRGQGNTGNGRAPLISFQPGDGVFLSPDVTGERTRNTAAVTVYRQPGDFLLTVDTYLSANQVASVQVSWRQLQNEPFDVQSANIREQPEDLRELIGLLRQATFRADAETGRMSLDDPVLAKQISATQATLSQRFLSTRWSIGPDLRVSTLYVTGQLPVYDDVEAVRIDKNSGNNQNYQVTGLASYASAADLRLANANVPEFVQNRYLQLPTTVTDRTRALTSEIIAGADNRYDQALAVQNYLRGAFVYDEKVKTPPADQDVVDYFLFDSQRGYCEYFASAMVVMLRSAGIPARIAAGFREVPYDQTAGGYLYREKQAHTWVEVFFEGYGWIPFEPTPSIAEPFSRGEHLSTEQPLPTPTPFVAPTPTPEPTAEPSTATPVPVETSDNSGQDGSKFISIPGGSSSLVVMGLILLGLLSSGFFTMMWLWKFRGMSPVAALFARVQRIGRWWGVTPDPAMTPVEYAEEIAHAVPAMRSPAQTLAHLYETEQYGRRPISEQEQTLGHSAWKEMRTAVLRSWHRRRSRRSEERRN